MQDPFAVCASALKRRGKCEVLILTNDEALPNLHLEHSQGSF